MKNPQCTDGHFLTHKVNIKFNVLGTTMLNRIDGEVNSTHVVTVNNCGSVNGTFQLLKKIAKPTCLCYGCCDDTVFRLCTRMRNSGLPAR